MIGCINPFHEEVPCEGVHADSGVNDVVVRVHVDGGESERARA